MIENIEKKQEQLNNNNSDSRKDLWNKSFSQRFFLDIHFKNFTIWHLLLKNEQLANELMKAIQSRIAQINDITSLFAYSYTPEFDIEDCGL